MTRSFAVFLCSICGKEFSKTKLDEHLKREHGDPKPYACDKCPMTFLFKKDLKGHSDVHNDIKYPCSVCHKTFNTKRTERAHFHNMHHANRNQKEIPCKECPLKFRTNYNLKKHMIKHTGEKPFKCSECDCAYIEMLPLKRHIAKKHTFKNIHQCKQCPESFRYLHDLRMHEFEHFKESKSQQT